MSDTAPEFSTGNKWFVAMANAIIKYAKGHGVNCAGIPGWSWTIDGWMPPVSSGGSYSPVFGFSVKSSGDEGEDVTVSASVVSGMGAWAVVPEINGIPLTDSPPPKLSVSGKRWVALYMEVVPDMDVIYIPASDDEDPIYGVMEGAGTLEDDKVEVRAYADEDEMSAASQPARVNAATGSVDDNGIYVIPLAYRSDPDGSWKQIGYTGPLGVRMCRSGAFIALSPARGTIVKSDD